MYVTRKEVKVYNHEEGKAISYMVVPYYELLGYNFEVERNM